MHKAAWVHKAAAWLHWLLLLLACSSMQLSMGLQLVCMRSLQYVQIIIKANTMYLYVLMPRWCLVPRIFFIYMYMKLSNPRPLKIETNNTMVATLLSTNTVLSECWDTTKQYTNSAARQLFVYTKNSSRNSYVNITQIWQGGCQINPWCMLR